MDEDEEEKKVEGDHTEMVLTGGGDNMMEDKRLEY